MRAVLVYSGGLDSTVLLYHMLDAGATVRALSIDYGQRHGVELKRAATIAHGAGVEHRLVDLRSVTPLLGGSSLTSHEIPVAEGHYAETSMKSTVVPNRNMIFLSLAAAWAISLKFDAIAYAAHSGDHTIYPDCREAFAVAMAAAVRLADWHEVDLVRPFVNFSKADIVRRGAALGAPLEQTWSCYKGGELHCGRCGTCIERREAFHLAAVDDPTHYAADAPAVEEMVAAGWRPAL